MALPEEVVSQLDEDVRSDPAIQDFNDVNGVVKSYIQTKKLVGESMRMPDRVQPEEKEQWWKETKGKLIARGFMEAPPEAPDKYEWAFENAPPETLASDKVLQKFAPIAHELGLTNKQATRLVEKFGSDLLPELMPEPQFADAAELVNKAFGKEATAKVDAYKQAMVQIQAEYPGLAEIVKDGVPMTPDGKFVNLFDHPDMMRFVLDHIKVQQDFAGNVNGKAAGESLDAVEAEIQAIKNDPNNPLNKLYWNDDIDNPAKKKMMELYKRKQAALDALKAQS